MKKRHVFGLLVLIGLSGTLGFAAISALFNLDFSRPQEPEKVLVQAETPEQDAQQKAEAERLRQPLSQSNPFGGLLPFTSSSPSSSTVVSPSPATATPQPSPSPSASASPQRVEEAQRWIADERLTYAVAEARKIVAGNPTIGLRLTPPNSEIDVFNAGNGILNTLRNENNRIVISISATQQNTVTIHVVEQNLYLYVVADGSYYAVKDNGNGQVEYLNPRKDAVEVGRILQRLQEDFKAIPVANPERGQRQDNEPTASPTPVPTTTP